MRTNLRNESCSYCKKCIEGSFLDRHTHKLLLKGLRYLFQARLQDFVCGTVVAEDVCEKGLEESLVYSFIRKQILNIEQAPRMLTIECYNQFSRVEICE